MKYPKIPNNDITCFCICSIISLNLFFSSFNFLRATLPRDIRTIDWILMAASSSGERDRFFGATLVLLGALPGAFFDAKYQINYNLARVGVILELMITGG